MDFYRSFTLALFNDDLEGLERLLTDGMDPNERSSTGDTPLIAASRLAKRDCFVMKLLENGGDLETKHAANGQTPLIVVSQNGILKRVRLLLKLGANPNAVDDFGQTPLYVALVLNQKKFVGVVRELLAHGANPNIDGPRNPLMLAAENAHSGCIEALIEAGANVNTVQESGTPLIKAILGRRHDNLLLLLKTGADPNLSVPVECDDPQIAGRNAFEVAQLLGDSKVLELLQAAQG